MHERIGSSFKLLQSRATEEAGAPAWGSRLLDRFPSYPWQLLFVPVFGALGLFMIGFLWFELRDRCSRIVVVTLHVRFEEGTRRREGD